MKRLPLFLALAALALAGLGTPPAGASSHNEAPLIAPDPGADIIDFFVFRSPTNPNNLVSILTLNDHAPEQGRFARFDPHAIFEIHVDTNGDGRDDITYAFQFETVVGNPNVPSITTGPVTSLTDADLNIRQTFSMFRSTAGGAYQSLLTDRPTVPANLGLGVMPNYPMLASQGASTVPLGQGAVGIVCSGVGDDPHFGNLMTGITNGYNFFSNGRDAFAGNNVNYIALDVPIAALLGSVPTDRNAPNAVIGVRAGVRRQAARVLTGMGGSQEAGPFVPSDRMGNAHVNELFIPQGMQAFYKTSHPANDAQFAQFLRNPTVAQDFGAGKFFFNGSPLSMNVPSMPREDIVNFHFAGISGLNRFLGQTNPILMDLVRINVAIPVNPNPNRLGILAGDMSGYPNGRRLIDDVSDIALRLVAGATPLTPQANVAPNNTLTDGVNTNDVQFRTGHPYVALPRVAAQEFNG